MVLAHCITNGQRTQDVQISEDITFDTMLLSTNTLKGLKNCGFLKPSPIQLYAIPLGKCGFDLLLEAKSGTGKTAVFSVITLEKLDLAKGLQTVILAPTREIAAQICDVIIQIGMSHKGLQVEVVMGGLPVQDDIDKFKKIVHVVVGSPGRLRHLIHDKYIDISSVRLLVLDEADKLMEKTFQNDIQYIFSMLPKQKQVIMSSATYPDSAKIFINQYVQGAQIIRPDSNSILLGITQKVAVVKCNSNIVTQTQHRMEEVFKILTKKQFKQCLIFCNYQARVSEVHKILIRNKWPAEQLYGSQHQTERLDALKTLQEYKCRILISTDLAARGIDASNVDLIINLEPPFDWQTYLHRIGRAGRYGSYGSAISILSEGKEVESFKKLIQSMKYSLNLKYMWTDSEFLGNGQIPDLCASLSVLNEKNPTDNKLDNKLQEIWDFYSSENGKINLEVNNFDKLCESFEHSTDLNIETFSSLLQSYDKNDNCQSDYYSYKHLIMQGLPVLSNSSINFENTKNQSNLSQIPEIKNMSHKIKTNNANLLLNENINEAFIGISKQEQDNSKMDFKSCKNINKPNYSNAYKLNKINEHHETNRTKYNSDVKKLSQPPFASTADALRNAGLPTHFGKTQKKHLSNFCASDNKYTEEYCEELKQSNSMPGYSDCDQNSINDLISSDDDSESDSESDFESESESDSDSNVNDFNENYINWYRKLKLQMKQYELAMYIEEMSRLK